MTIEIKGKILCVGEWQLDAAVGDGYIERSAVEIQADDDTYGPSNGPSVRVPVSREQAREVAKHLYERVTLQIEFEPTEAK